MIIVILGMHCSGTSMLSSIVHSLGISMGPEADLKRNNPYSQPYGYWEDQGFVSLNNQIIKAAGGHWHEPPGRLKILVASIQYRDKISQLVERRRENANWGWKDPRNCLCIECYQYVFKPEDNVKYIHILRSKRAIADSLIRRDEASGKMSNRAEVWEQLACEYERRVYRFCNQYQVTRYITSYGDILKYPRYEVEQLAGYLGVRDRGLIEAATGRVKQ